MIAFAAALLASLSVGPLPAVPRPTSAPPAAEPPNILILLLDDVGVDALSVYGLGSDLPSTPHIDALAARGVRFENAWSNPVCSPTRATIQTGRYGFRTGIGYTVTSYSQELDTAEVTLPEMLRISGVPYESGAFGKWHLGNGNNGGTLSPNVAGYNHYEGALINLHPPENYFRWDETVDGNTSVEMGYITTDEVNDARDWIQAQPSPWLAYVAFHAPHTPHHAPPANLHTVDLEGAGDPLVNARPYWKAMVEAVDHEIGRLLEQININYSKTLVILLADNGTHMDVIVPPFLPSHGKGTAYQGGIQVPLIIAGPGVAQNRTCSALVNTTDILATVAEVAGAKYPPLFPGTSPGWRMGTSLPGVSVPLTHVGNEVDSVSLVPYFSDPDLPSLREYVWAELFRPSDGTAPVIIRQAIRNDRYKVIFRKTPQTGPEMEFFDLQNDPFELVDLLALGDLSPGEQAAFDELVSEAVALLASK